MNTWNSEQVKTWLIEVISYESNHTPDDLTTLNSRFVDVVLNFLENDSNCGKRKSQHNADDGDSSFLSNKNLKLTHKLGNLELFGTTTSADRLKKTKTLSKANSTFVNNSNKESKSDVIISEDSVTFGQLLGRLNFHRFQRFYRQIITADKFEMFLKNEIKLKDAITKRLQFDSKQRLSVNEVTAPSTASTNMVSVTPVPKLPPRLEVESSVEIPNDFELNELFGELVTKTSQFKAVSKNIQVDTIPEATAATTVKVKSTSSSAKVSSSFTTSDESASDNLIPSKNQSYQPKFVVKFA